MLIVKFCGYACVRHSKTCNLRKFVILGQNCVNCQIWIGSNICCTQSLIVWEILSFRIKIVWIVKFHGIASVWHSKTCNWRKIMSFCTKIVLIVKFMVTHVCDTPKPAIWGNLSYWEKIVYFVQFEWVLMSGAHKVL